MHVNDWCPPKHLEASDLNGDTVVTIESYDREAVGKAKDICPTLTYKEFSRSHVFNKTNKKRVVAMLGTTLEEWIGKQITLYPSETDYEDKVVPCIRVRPSQEATS